MVFVDAFGGFSVSLVMASTLSRDSLCELARRAEDCGSNRRRFMRISLH
jgi:hypothetical protein